MLPPNSGSEAVEVGEQGRFMHAETKQLAAQSLLLFGRNS